jgi:CBS domain-containing protein
VRAADLMSTPVVAVRADDTVASAYRAMLRNGLRHVVVLVDRTCAGVLDDRVLALSRADVMTPVIDLVARRTTCVLADAPLERVARVMVRDRTDAVPVVDTGGHVVGIVTAYDVLRAVAASQIDLTERQTMSTSTAESMSGSTTG